MKQKTLAITIGLILASQGVAANPSGAQVVHGSATFSSPSADVLNVHNSQNAIINWQSFNIGQGQTTNFIQPSAASSVLNRVVSNNPSQLLGNLNSNGHVYLINQNGILVGQDAQINTAGFFASTLNITDADYLNGNLKFEGGGLGGIENQGYIHAGDNGHIVLIAPNIENGGVVEVDNGNVILAAGKSITITSLENSAIQFEVTGSEDSVTNLGQIIANNGAASLFAGSLKHSGSIRASGLVQDADGTIRLVATDSNSVSGSLDVGGEKGGRIEVLGETVSIESGARVDASGTVVGGEILIGGDQQGLNPEIMNATSTSVAAGAEVHADGIDQGNGGRVIVFAENDVHVHGELTATGGALGGDGGFIETSGLRILDITSVPDASAANGKAGQWLIDPDNITIFSGTGTHDPADYDQPFTSSVDTTFLGASLISQALTAGTSVEISTGEGGGGAGDIKLQSSATAGPLSILSSSTTDVTLTLNAHNDIVVDTDNAGAVNIGADGAGVLNVVFNADSELDGNGSISFITGTGTGTSPITINSNGGFFSTNTDVLISGDGSTVTVNADWTIPQLTTLTVDRNLVINSPGTTITNFGEIIVGSTDALSQVSLSTSGDTLDLVPGSVLSGYGTVVGNVEVNGGVVSGGSGLGFGSTEFPGTLNVQGDFTMNSGLLYSMWIGGDGIIPSSVQVDGGTARINGGSAMIAWARSDALTDALVNWGSGSVSLVTCVSVGCVDGNSAGFDTLIGPLTSIASSNGQTITTDSVAFDYALETSANVVTWTGQAGDGSWSSASNWSSGEIPGVDDYVFIHNPSGSEVITLAAGESAAGVQSFEEIQLADGVSPSSGILNVDGDIFILDDAGLTDGRLILAGANTGIEGTGVLYMGPGSGLGISQGSLSKDVVNWGGVKTSVGNSFQLDSDLANFSLFLLDDSSGTNRIGGTGTITNLGVLDFGLNGSLDLMDSVTLTSASTRASFLGSDVLQLNDTSKFDVVAAPSVFSTAIGLELQGGILANAQNLPAFPTTINWYSGTISGSTGDFNILSGSVMNLYGTADMTFSGGLNLNNSGTIDFKSAGGDFIFNTGTLTNTGQIQLNHTSANADFTGTGQINNTSGTITLSSASDFNLGLNLNSDSDLNITSGDFVIDSTAFFQSGNINVADGATLTVADTLRLGSTFGVFSGGDGLGQMLVTGLLDLDASSGDLSGLKSLSVNGGTVNNIAGATLPATVNLSGGAILNGLGSLTISSSSTMNVNGATLQGNSGTLSVDNQGTINVASGQTLTLDNASLTNAAGGTLTGVGALIIPTGSALSTGGTIDIAGITLGGGTLTANSFSYAGDLTWAFGSINGSGTGLTTSGKVALTEGALNTDWTITPTGTVLWSGSDASTLTVNSGKITNQGKFTISSFVDTDTQQMMGKDLSGTSTAEFINKGLLIVDADAAPGVAPADTVVFDLAFDMDGGTLVIKSGAFKLENSTGEPVPLVLNQGDSLQGFGTFDGTVINQGGTVSPGRTDLSTDTYTTGKLTIKGDLVQGQNGELVIKLDSTSTGLLHDALFVDGQLDAGGTIKFTVVNGKSPTQLAMLIDQSFVPLKVGSLANRFDSVEIPPGLNFTFSPTGEIIITSDSLLLNKIANQLEVLLDSGDLSFAQIVRAMRSIDRGVRVRFDDEEENGDRRAPRLVCR